MKFLSQLASCWGGAAVTPAAEASGGGRLTEERRRYCHVNNNGGTTSKRVKHSREWKPELTEISENRPISEATERGGADGNRRLVKVKPKKSMAPFHEEDYLNFAHTMALPAFPPIPSLF